MRDGLWYNFSRHFSDKFWFTVLIPFWQKLTQGKPAESSSGSDRFCINWILPGQLAIGPLPIKPAHYTRLQQENIQALLSLCAETEGCILPAYREQFQCYSYPLRDSHYEEPMKPEELGEAVALVHKNMSQKKSLYVHCFAAIERSPTVCIAYLCRHQKLELWEAVRCLKQVHPRSAPTAKELQAIQVYLSD